MKTLLVVFLITYKLKLFKFKRDKQEIKEKPEAIENKEPQERTEKRKKENNNSLLIISKKMLPREKAEKEVTEMDKMHDTFTNIYSFINSNTRKIAAILYH